MSQIAMMNIMDRCTNMIDKYDGYDRCVNEKIYMMDRQIDMINMKDMRHRYD